MSTTSPCRVAFIFYVLCFVALLVAFASPFWISADVFVIRVNIGLWHVCEKLPDGTGTCVAVSLNDMSGWFKATACLMISAVIAAVIAGCTHMYMPITAGFQILAGKLALIAVILFGSNAEKRMDSFEWYDDDDNSPLHWAYGLAFIAAVSFIINGIILMVRGRGDMRRNLPCEANAPPEIQMYPPRGVQIQAQGPTLFVGPYSTEQPASWEPTPAYAGQFEKDGQKLVNEA